MRTESILRPDAGDVAIVESDAYDKGVHVSLRMPVIPTRDGLLLYSPVAIDDEIAESIGDIGEVASIFAPNRNHHLFVPALVERYPDATLYGVHGHAKKHPELTWHEAPRQFDESIVNIPIEGVPFASETVSFHVPTRTLFCADLVQNMWDEPHFVSRMVCRMIGAWQTFGPNRVWRMNTRDHVAFARSIDAILELQPERIVMSHGRIVDSDATESLRYAMEWVKRE